METNDQGGLIERRQAQARAAESAILAALGDAGPSGSTVPDIARTCDLGEVRVRNRLRALVADARVRQERRTYFLVQPGAQLALVDQARIDQRASFMRNAERESYLGKLADLLLALDRRSVPAGLREPAAAAQSIVRDVSRAVEDSDYEKFVLIRADWSPDIDVVMSLIGRIEQATREQKATIEAQNKWRAAHNEKIDRMRQDVLAQRRRLTRKLNKFLDLDDSIPQPGGFKYRVPLTRFDIEEYEDIGLIETSWRPDSGIFLFQCKYDTRIGFQRQRQRFFESASETCRVTWADIAPCIQAAINTLDAHIQTYSNRLVQLAAEKQRGVPEIVHGQLEIEQ